MKEYQQRVIDELAQLNEKRDKLRGFIQNPKKFNELDEEDQSLLVGQFNLMTQYADILKRRIARFE